ncbi:MAG TPA: hypothetical protein VII49_06815 [Rhizomicrobium sp.]
MQPFPVQPISPEQFLAFDFPKLGTVLKLAEIYDGLQFRDRPRLVEA